MLRVAFVIPNLMPFGGNSATVLKYAKAASETCQEVVIFQSYRFRSSEEFPLDQLKNLGNIKVVTLRGKWYKIVDVTRGIPYGFVFHYMLFPVFVLYRRIANRSAIKEQGIFDGIYCFDFVDTGIFGHSARVIVLGTHNQKMGYYKVKAINAGIFLRKVNGFRLFESEKEFVSQLGKEAIVVQKGVDTGAFHPRADGANNKTRFLYVARLDPKKGVEILIDAWTKAGIADQAELQIVGTGSLAHYLSQLRLDSVKYQGPLYGEELQKAYRDSDVFVFPTQWDAQPSSVMEAASSGLHVLCSDYLQGVFDDLRSEGYLEYVANSSDRFAVAMKNCLGKFGDNFDERRKMHSYVEANRSQRMELSIILNFMKSLENKE